LSFPGETSARRFYRPESILVFTPLRPGVKEGAW
jgi:hypothetical protein